MSISQPIGNPEAVKNIATTDKIKHIIVQLASQDSLLDKTTMYYSRCNGHLHDMVTPIWNSVRKP